ncbi:MAG: hypothetical protein GX591_17070 [Planctomycetes bacterium]|nr:hypothetical protein [Planctomycetota bacterium]
MSLVARLVQLHQGFNALNIRTVCLYLQKSPGTPGITRGIDGADYRVLADGSEIARGRTGSNGRIDVRLRPGVTTTVEVLGSVYEVTRDAAALAAVNTTEGRKERLRCLGYQIGHGGANGDGVDNNAQVFEYERSVLDFQAEHGVTLDADETTLDGDLESDVGD